MDICEINTKYQNLKRQLVNAGEEESVDEVMWNDTVYEAMQKLIEGVSEDIQKLIKLNHLS
jgi:hypothetical protein